MGLITKLFGTYSERELKSIYPIVDKIEAMADEYHALTDEELRKLLSGHLCRCTGYENILRAVKKTMYRRLGLPMPAEPEA